MDANTTVKARAAIPASITREHVKRLRGRYRGKGLLQALVVGKKRERGE